MTSYRRSRFPRPIRDDAGIVLPEYILFAALSGLPEKLQKRIYLDNASEEPVITELTGLSQDLIENCLDGLSKKTPRVTLGFPKTVEQLPSIAIVCEDMQQSSSFIGDVAGEIDMETVAVEDEVSVESAVGGELSFSLHNKNVIPSSVVLTITRSGVVIPLFPTYNEFTVTSAGVVTLASALVAGDIVTANYGYFDTHGGQYKGAIFTFNHVIFIETINPLLTSFLFGLVWRELMLYKASMEASGFSDLEISRRAFSLWNDMQPPYAFRTELVVSGKTEWKTYYRKDPIKTLIMNFDETDGDEDVVNLELDIAALGESTFENE